MNNNGLFSVDRLVEFGLGMAMARQMVDMFNSSMAPITNNAATPNYTQPSMQPTLMYVSIDSKPAGPMQMQDVITLFKRHEINVKSLAWMPGMSKWKAIEDVPEILRALALMPPPLPENRLI